MKGSLRFLAALASLFVLFTTSYAGWVCIGKLPNTKNYAVFQVGDEFSDATCSFTPLGSYCCADIPIDGSNKLVAYFTQNDGTVVERGYTLLVGREKGVDIVKVFTKYDAYITVYGPEGNYLLREVLPKENIKLASDVETTGFVVEYDPVIAWFVSLDGNKPKVVSYTVKRGSVPSVLPRIELASCDLKVNKLRSNVLSDGEESYLVYEFEVLLAGERVIPSPSSVSILVNGRQATFSVKPEEKVLQIYTPIGKGAGSATVEIEVRLGDCKDRFTETVKIVSGSSQLLLYAGLFLLAVALFLWYRSRA